MKPHTFRNSQGKNLFCCKIFQFSNECWNFFLLLLSNCSIHNVNGGEERRGRQIKYKHNTFASSNSSTLYKWSSKKIKTCAEQPLSAAQSESRQNLAQSENHDSNQPKLWSLSGGILGVFDILIKIRSFLKMLILKYWYQKDILENIKIFWWNIDINCRYITITCSWASHPHEEK